MVEQIIYRMAQLSDLDAVKDLADKHVDSLGFVLRPALEKSIQDRELIVAVMDYLIVGFVHYHFRRDNQVTLYHIVVDEEFQGEGIGRGLVEELIEEAKRANKLFILLKCVVGLYANGFYESLGFQLSETQAGKKRALNVWIRYLDFGFLDLAEVQE